MSAFDPGRVGIWCNSFNTDRLSKLANFGGGIFTDYFYPRTVSRAQMDQARSITRPAGATMGDTIPKMRAQTYQVPHGLGVDDFVIEVSKDITALAPGVVELDIEVDDTHLSGYLRDVVVKLRKGDQERIAGGLPARWQPHPTFLFRLNIAPGKGAFLPVDLLQSDPYLYAAEQTYYGDMSRVSEDYCFMDLLNHGVPAAKAQLCYGAGGPVKLDGTRGITLGSVMYNGEILRGRFDGLVFTDDLMAEVGLL